MKKFGKALSPCSCSAAGRRAVPVLAADPALVPAASNDKPVDVLVGAGIASITLATYRRNCSRMEHPGPRTPRWRRR